MRNMIRKKAGNPKELVQRLKHVKPKEINVVVMPDFFLDRIIAYPRNLEGLTGDMSKIVKQKGGSIDGIKQRELRGGNAVNTASALAKLGVKVHPIVCTDKLGYYLLKFYLGELNIDLSHVKIREHMSITTAIEIPIDYGKANVMLRDLGSLESFGTRDLTKEDFQLLERADYVCVFNWAGTRRYGTQLIEKAFSHVKTKGRGKTYLDTADPSPNKKQIPELIERVFLRDLIDVLSLNENEAVWYAAYFEPEKVAKLKKSMKLDMVARESAKILAKHLTAQIDLHTTRFAASYMEGKETLVSSFNVKVIRSTGAGDAWNAGNIYADSQGFPARTRLMFANAVAAYYVSSREATHPTLSELSDFLLSKTSKNL